jgi:hypothetical protein
MHLSRLIQIANFFEVEVDYFVGNKEKTVFYVNEMSNSKSNKDCCNQYHAQSVEEKSALLLKERENEVENLKAQILQLQEINALLKKNS